MSMRRPSDPAQPARVLFCGDRAVGVAMVELIRHAGDEIVALGVNSPPHASHAEEVRGAAGVELGLVFRGRGIACEAAMRRLEETAPDLGVCCGFATILNKRLLAIPRWGWVNVHRSYLPYNRGVNPLQWAMVDQTPAGVTLHVMTEQVDAGPIIGQTQIPVYFTDNAQTLEDRADQTALELLRVHWPRLRRGDIESRPQDEDLATYHSLADSEALFRLDLDQTMPVRRLLAILRGHSSARGSAIDVTVGALRYTVHTQVVQLVQAKGADLESRPAHLAAVPTLTNRPPNLKRSDIS